VPMTAIVRARLHEQSGRRGVEPHRDRHDRYQRTELCVRQPLLGLQLRKHRDDDLPVGEVEDHQRERRSKHHPPRGTPVRSASGVRCPGSLTPWLHPAASPAEGRVNPGRDDVGKSVCFAPPTAGHSSTAPSTPHRFRARADACEGRLRGVGERLARPRPPGRETRQHLSLRGLVDGLTVLEPERPGLIGLGSRSCRCLSVGSMCRQGYTVQCRIVNIADDSNVQVAPTNPMHGFRAARLVSVNLNSTRVSQFPGAALVRGPRGHAGDVWFVDLGG
jgi:hypothetical protein